MPKLAERLRASTSAVVVPPVKAPNRLEVGVKRDRKSGHLIAASCCRRLVQGTKEDVAEYLSTQLAGTMTGARAMRRNRSNRPADMLLRSRVTVAAERVRFDRALGVLVGHLVSEIKKG